MTTTAHRPARSTEAPARPTRRLSRGGFVPTLVLLAAVAYFLVPVVWVVFAATKTTGELFNTPSFELGSGFGENLAQLFTYQGGAFAQWMGNSFIYAIGGALISTIVSAAAGYALALYDFPGKRAIMVGLLGGVLLPTITLTIPQYMLFAEWGLTNTYWAVLLPVAVTPFGVYLAFVYARASVPRELLEAGRVDGSSEARTFASIGMPLLLPGLVTIFLLQFIGIWNNFLLPYIMQSDSDLAPVTVALYLMLNRGGSEPILYAMAITGALVAILPVIAFVLFLQRFWRLDLVSGSLK